MERKAKKWHLINQQKGEIVDLLLQNRGLITAKAKQKFFKPLRPQAITLQSLGIKKTVIRKVITRLQKAKKAQENIIIYGDYDADGICGTAILWECLYSLGYQVLPYIPKRFSEGYGIKAESVKKLKETDPKLGLIITVDNGIVANKEIAQINKLGIEVVVCDHHTLAKKLPPALSIIHTTQICGAALAWILAKEINKKTKGLELAAIGTIADQMPLLGLNRSFAKYGLEALRKTKKPGLLALFQEAGIQPETIGTYEVNYLIAPRLNATGRLADAIDSLRLLCVNNKAKAKELARHLGATNQERQRIVEQVLTHAQGLVKAEKKVIILADESYHEGVIGLAAGKLVEEFYRPAIIFSKGKEISKASARSVAGFNIIEAIRLLQDLLEEGGGHPMAAGFSIRTVKLTEFIRRFEKENEKKLTAELLSPKLSIDLELEFKEITYLLVQKISDFEPFGLGNPTPTFISRDIEIVNTRVMGSRANHLRLKLKSGEKIFSAVGFGMGQLLPELPSGIKIDVVYTIELNRWNNDVNIELRLRDLRTHPVT